MEKKAIFLIIVMILVLNVGIVQAGLVGDFLNFFFGSQNEQISSASIITSPAEWQVTHASGTEGQLTFWTANGKDKKTELGWILPSGETCSSWLDIQAYDKHDLKLKDDKNSDLKIKCKSNKCDGQACYHIKLKDGEAININEFVKLGENSIITEYQNQSRNIFEVINGVTDSLLSYVDNLGNLFIEGNITKTTPTGSNVECIIQSNGKCLFGFNSTCTFQYSPDGSTTQESCN